jgi:hypothetical protein
MVLHFLFLLELAVQSSYGLSPPLIFWSPNLFRHMVGLLGRVINSLQGLYLHRTTQHRKTRDKYPCPKWDSNPRSSVRAIEARASDRAALDRPVLHLVILIISIMKLLIMHFLPASCDFIHHRSKYYPMHPVLKHLQSDLPLRRDTKFHTHTRQKKKK